MPITSARRLQYLAAFAIAVIIAMVLAAIFFETGHAPVEYVLRSYGWPALIAALPLVYLVIAFRKPSRAAIALGIAYPLVVLIAFALTLVARYQSGTEGQMDVVYSFVFFWFNVVWAIFILVFTPTMVCLFALSALAYIKLPNRSVLPIFGWMVVLLVGGAIAAAGRLTGTTPDADVPEYRPDVVDNAIRPLNECIWRAAGRSEERGFPDSLAAIRNVAWRTYPGLANKYPNECIEEMDALPTQPFTVEYTASDRDAAGLAHGFTLRLIEKTRPGGRPRVTWYDHTGLRRDGFRNASGGVDSVQVRGAGSLKILLIVQHYVDDYGREHGGTFPTRVIPDWRYRDSVPPAGVLKMEDVGECSQFEQPNVSCIEKWDRQVVYERVGNGRAYTLQMWPVTYYDNEEQQPLPSRTHFRDADGAIHSYGGWRSAINTDPPPDSVELSLAIRDLKDFLRQNR